MTKFYAALLGSTLLFASPTLAQSPLDGTWKADLKSGTLDAKPDEFLLTGNTYSCKSCLPPYTVTADGKFHPVADRPYWDEISIKVVDPRTVAFQLRKGGKLIGENRRTVSADGKSMTIVSTNTNNAAGAKVDQTNVETRVGAPIAGAHLISGSWQPDMGQATSSDNATTMTMRLDGDMLHMTSPMGETLTAKLGGDYAPNVGDPGKTMTKAVLLGANKLELTDMRDGKVVQVTTYAVSDDGTMLDAMWSDPRDGSKGSFKAKKQ